MAAPIYDINIIGRKIVKFIGEVNDSKLLFRTRRAKSRTIFVCAEKRVIQVTGFSRSLRRRLSVYTLRARRSFATRRGENGRQSMATVKTMERIQAEACTIDRENAWLLFASFCGDVERTALALNVAPATVIQVADDEGWLQRLKPIVDLKKSGRPGDIERALNRAVNYVQAHKFRLIVERTLQRITGLSTEEFDRLILEKPGKDGIRETALTTRAIADLASALEKAQAMSYAALQDTGTDRAHRKEGGSEIAATEMYDKMAAAMAAVKGSVTPRALLLDAQLAAAAELTPPKYPKPEPPDDTYENE